MAVKNMSRIILIALIGCAAMAAAAPYQELEPKPGFIPVFIREGNTPLSEIHPMLAEAFGELDMKMVNDANRNEGTKIIKKDIANQHDVPPNETDENLPSEPPIRTAANPGGALASESLLNAKFSDTEPQESAPMQIIIAPDQIDAMPRMDDVLPVTEFGSAQVQQPNDEASDEPIDIGGEGTAVPDFHPGPDNDMEAESTSNVKYEMPVENINAPTDAEMASMGSVNTTNVVGDTTLESDIASFDIVKGDDPV